VPVLPVYFNYRRKVMGFLPLIALDLDTDEGVTETRQLLERHGARKPTCRVAGERRGAFPSPGQIG
jgi:hypothetical protein